MGREDENLRHNRREEKGMNGGDYAITKKVDHVNKYYVLKSNTALSRSEVSEGR